MLVKWTTRLNLTYHCITKSCMWCLLFIYFLCILCKCVMFLIKIQLCLLRLREQNMISVSFAPNGHHSNVIKSTMASQITSPTIVYSTVCSFTDQSKHQSSASLVLVRGINRWPDNFTHKGPITQRMFPFDGVIRDMWCPNLHNNLANTQMQLCKIIISNTFQ